MTFEACVPDCLSFIVNMFLVFCNAIGTGVWALEL
jgi:hypothetical protein